MILLNFAHLQVPVKSMLFRKQFPVLILKHISQRNDDLNIITVRTLIKVMLDLSDSVIVDEDE